VGAGKSYVLKPEEEWIAISVPPIISQEEFARVQEKLAHNQQTARRNTQHRYLLRGHVSCGQCHLTAAARTTPQGYQYYVCRGRTDQRRGSQEQHCTSRYIPAEQLDAVVWADLCVLLSDPEQIAMALERARSGAWVPQELQARQANICQAIATLEHQQERLLTAYLGEVVELPEFERKRRELGQKLASLQVQRQQIEAQTRERRELEQVAASVEQFCVQVRAGLEAATFEQKRQLVELLVDQVVVANEEVEIRYVMPTSPNGARQPFCQLRLDYRGGLSQGVSDLCRRAGQPRSIHRGCLQHQAASLQLRLSATRGVRSEPHPTNG
jgi:site-specific DNA recombinase